MREYRIVTNGFKYAIQEKKRLFGFSSWRFVEDGHEYSEPLMFNTKTEAAVHIGVLHRIDAEVAATEWREVV